jgi:hypothetical protein
MKMIYCPHCKVISIGDNCYRCGGPFVGDNIQILK